MKNFDFIAPFYDRLVKIIFGRRLYDAQVALFKYVPKNASVLIIGGGTGTFLNQFIAEAAPAHIDYLEASQKMLEIACNSHQTYQNIRFIYGNENSEVVPGSGYDIVLIPFVFDLYTEHDLNLMVIKLKSKLKPDAVWLVTDFYADTNSARLHQALLKVMYWFFKFISGVKAMKLPDYMLILKQNHLYVVREQRFIRGFVRSYLYSSGNI